MEQSDFLLSCGDSVELSADQVILGGAEENVLSFRHLDDDHCLLFRQSAVLDYKLLHRAGLLLADVEVGAGNAAEQKSKRGDVARPLGIKAVEFLDNLANGFSVSRGALLFLQSQEFPD